MSTCIARGRATTGRTSRVPIIACVLLLLSAGIIGCGDRPQPPASESGQRPDPKLTASGATAWSRIDAETIGEVEHRQLEVADAARRDMGAQLMSELVAALDSDTPASAIDVCSQAAPRIASEVAARHGVRIGRTSHRLRNPTNRPPAWAEPLVASHRATTQPHAGPDAGRSETSASPEGRPRLVARPAEPILMTGPDGELGVLSPILLKPECEICHGTPGAIAEEVREQIAAHYPDDTATGFAAGDLRGWFWVEVPPPPPGS